ncbi:hypothetical protein AB0H57_01555 [Micromonospora sp. NPDC050686]|uniref:hypothetical protein n=1 Tax=Micromonospora sp. NPDC050686 TaxID=3154631 RepID=UPI0033EBA5F3
MSQPPANPYPPQPGSGAPYGSYPPPQQPGGYPPVPGGHPGGYGDGPGGYPAPPQPGHPVSGGPGGYPGPPQPGGFPPGDPAYGGPAGAPPKKSRVGRILLIVLAAVLLLCLGGGAAVWYLVKDDVKETVDATKVRVVAPDTLGGRARATDPRFEQGAGQLESGLKESLPGSTSTVGAFYGSLEERNLVMVAAASGLNTDPDKTLDESIRGARSSAVELGEMKNVEPGPLGGSAKCGDAETQKVPLGVCLWSDKGSLGMVIMYFKSGAEAQAELADIRGQIEQK